MLLCDVLLIAADCYAASTCTIQGMYLPGTRVPVFMNGRTLLIDYRTQVPYVSLSKYIYYRIAHVMIP